jgi:hypothetical protein
MKCGVLRSIGHNIVYSLASGCGLLVGVYEMDVFVEAARSAEGFITVDFLTGTSTGGTPSPALARAVALYREGVAILCAKEGVSPSAFNVLTARYWTDNLGVHLGRRFLVIIEDDKGRQAIDEYTGASGSRVRTIDGLGRLRRK